MAGRLGTAGSGIDVISTVSIGHLDSLTDVMEKITGVPPAKTVPDQVVRAADEIELVDLAPEMLRDRMARGDIYPAEQAEAALAGGFASGPCPQCASSPCSGWPPHWLRTRAVASRRPCSR